MHTNETKDKFIELRLKGASLADIAKKIGVSKTTLVDWNQRYADEIRSLRSAELEALHARILQSYRADFDRLDRIQSALDRRTSERCFGAALGPLEAVRADQIVRTQFRHLRKDIEAFSQITGDTKKPATSAAKSETSNSNAGSLSVTPRFNEGSSQPDEASKTVSTVSAPAPEPSENLTVS